jgi:hypothetical protein
VILPSSYTGLIQKSGENTGHIDLAKVMEMAPPLASKFAGI